MEHKYVKIIATILISISILIFLDNNRLTTTEYNIYSSKINKELKIAHISDFHDTNLDNYLVVRLKKEKPDIIAITGDFIDSRRCDVAHSINFIEQIVDIAPIYYVNGNHELSREEEYNLLKTEFDRLGVYVLEDSMRIFSDDINIVGLNDPSFFKKSNITVEERLNKIEFDKINFTLLLSHRPELFEKYQGKEIDLVLTGHAHGGQFRFPFIGGLYAPHQGVFPEYDSGIFGEETKMIVSRGIGNSRFPIRINNVSELIIVNVRKI